MKASKWLLVGIGLVVLGIVLWGAWSARRGTTPPGQPPAAIDPNQSRPPNQMIDPGVQRTFQTIDETNRINRLNRDQQTPAKKDN